MSQGFVIFFDNIAFFFQANGKYMYRSQTSLKGHLYYAIILIKIYLCSHFVVLNDTEQDIIQWKYGAVTSYLLPFPNYFIFGLGLASKPKGHSCHTKNQLLPKPFTEKTSKSAKYPLPLHYKITLLK